MGTASLVGLGLLLLVLELDIMSGLNSEIENRVDVFEKEGARKIIWLLLDVIYTKLACLCQDP